MLTPFLKSLVFLTLISNYGSTSSNLRKINNPEFNINAKNKLGFLASKLYSQPTHRHNYELYARPGQRREVYNKRDLVSQVAEKLNKTQKEVGEVLDEFLSTIKRHLSNDSEVSLSKFGVFKNSLRGERRMRNLQTGEIFTAKPVHVPSLRFYDTFKNEVNDKLKSNKRSNFSSYNY